MKGYKTVTQDSNISVDGTHMNQTHRFKRNVKLIKTHCGSYAVYKRHIGETEVLMSCEAEMWTYVSGTKHKSPSQNSSINISQRRL